MPPGLLYLIGPIYLTSMESLDGTLGAAYDVPVCLVPSDVETGGQIVIGYGR